MGESWQAGNEMGRKKKVGRKLRQMREKWRVPVEENMEAVRLQRG
jgi:hypothetical protein